MKILITGASGLVGYAFLTLLKGHCLVATSREIPNYLEQFNPQQMNIMDKTQVHKIIAAEKPEVVIHCAAHTGVDRCETHPAEAQALNVEGTRNVAEACKQAGAKIVFLSTEYVFDGKSGPYSEKDIPHPLSVYAKTKLEGEKLVAEMSALSHLIIRTTVVYGIHPGGKNFVTWLIGELQQGKRQGNAVRIVEDQWSTPTFVNQLVRAIEFLLQKGKEGVWNVGDGWYGSRYQFALMVAEVFGLEKRLIHPIATKELRQAALRPLKAGLKLDKLRNAGFSLEDTKRCLTMLRSQLPC